jgi:hypothetical protein
MRIEIQCACGAPLLDKSDHLPHKAHCIPDQEWEQVFESIEEIISQVAAGRRERESALDAVHRALCSAAREMYQCRSCGRMFIPDRDGRLHVYAPQAPEPVQEVLRSRNP